MKTVLVTGASSGIGREIAIKFAENGYNVIINYLSNEKGAQKTEQISLKNGVMTMCLKADVSDPLQVEVMIKNALNAFGKIDILVCCSGISKICPTTDYTQTDYDNIIGINFGGTFNAVKTVLPSMIKNNFGKIIIISSVWGLKGSSCESLYCASKSAQIGFMKSIAREYACCNITANCIAPGLIDTKMNDELTCEEKNEIIKQIPLGRIGKTEDVANVALFLASDNASYITGQVITADGGWI